MKNNMKLTAVIVCCTNFLISVPALADSGICLYGKNVLESVDCIGVATLDGTTVSNTTQIIGPMHAKNATLNILKVKGVASIENSQIQGQANFIGPLLSNNNTFLSGVTIDANESTMITTTVKGKVSVQSNLLTPHLNIKSNSHLNNVEFTGHAGVVVVDNNSSVDGKVINGKIQKR